MNQLNEEGLPLNTDEIKATVFGRSTIERKISVEGLEIENDEVFTCSGCECDT